MKVTEAFAPDFSDGARGGGGVFIAWLVRGFVIIYRRRLVEW